MTCTAYCHVTIILSSGREVSGRAVTAAVAKLEAKLADKTPPPMAA
jgi:hypothetical protein